MSSLQTRPATAKDLPDVVAMAHALAAFHGEQATLTREAVARDALAAPPWITVLVAERNNDLLGYAALCPLVQVQYGLRGMDMHHLFVQPDERGTGVGRALIDASIQAAAAMGCYYLAVGTHPDNDPAQAFYEGAGFERTETGPRFRLRLGAAG